MDGLKFYNGETFMYSFFFGKVASIWIACERINAFIFFIHGKISVLLRVFVLFLPSFYFTSLYLIALLFFFQLTFFIGFLFLRRYFVYFVLFYFFICFCFFKTLFLSCFLGYFSPVKQGLYMFVRITLYSLILSLFSETHSGKLSKIT